jgi:hypothetical protein
MSHLLVVEVRRALHRRLVWALLALALLGIVVAGVVEFLASRDLDLAVLRGAGHQDPAVMTDWWISGSTDGPLAVGALLLVMGALVGGASVAGAEWRAGTVTTVLTWEPRRARLLGARVAAAGLLAAMIAIVLEVLLLVAFVPSVLAHGSTAGVDGAWLLMVLAALLRIGLLVGLVAAVACSLATLGRNTAAGIVVAWVWLAFVESALRGWKPGLAQWLVADTTSVVLGWGELEGDRAGLSPVVALTIVLLYSGLLIAGATATFCRRDVA